MTSELQLTLLLHAPTPKRIPRSLRSAQLLILQKLVFFGIDWEGSWTDEKNNILVEDLNTSDEVTIYFADEVHLGL